MSEIVKLSPELIWKYFYEITQIPRPSKKEERIIQYLVEFAESQGLEYRQDKIQNIVICKPATAGFEDRPTVILQSHVDMVCEKNTDTDFNFDTDPIQTYIDEGWVKAKGTTLGGDDGIGVATQLALLAAKEVEHPAIECLFTVDEETGLTGAFELGDHMLTGSVLLNLDSEDWGELFIGCAGGVDTIAKLPLEWETTPAGYFGAELKVKGLQGGHSGGDIHKGLGNANKILNRFLFEEAEKYALHIADFDGGNLRNAIAREAKAVVAVPMSQKETLRANLNVFISEMEAALGKVEPDFTIELSSVDLPKEVMKTDLQQKMLQAIYACPHGVVAWSKTIDNLVETSTNLASVKFKDGQIVFTTSQRSSVGAAKEDIRQTVSSVFRLAGASVEHSDGYPGWEPNPSSPVVATTIEVFKALFEEEPKVLAIHAGLECGLFLEKYPHLDMISFGPTIYGAHSPDERMNIETVAQFWDLLKAVLKNI